MTRTALLSTVGALALALPAQADFKLGDRYTDADGDLIADIPQDESEWLDPDTLIFAYTPVEDPAVYAEVWQGFLDHMAEVTGKKVQFFPVQSNAAQIEAMRAGRLHVAGFNTGSNPLAVACAGFRPFTMMAGRGWLLRLRDGDHHLSRVGHFLGRGPQGKELTFTSETSNSGFKAPSAILKGEFGLVAGEDFDTSFSGKHDNSILGVANKDYMAASIANSVKARMIERDVVDADQIEVVYQSQTFPTTGYGVVYNLHPDLQDKIKEAFFEFDWEGTALMEEFGKNGESQFIPITFKEDWAVIRTIDAANGVEYNCN